MTNKTQETVSGLKGSATSKEDFMRKLAQMETGEISDEALAKIDGGISFPGAVFGLYIPTKDILTL
ncbi:hypothetical protein [Dyadobacter diqingensis]|uniref:hypothetical protein n=1 Tax=Dyadobacter diqingensis TaxID=2938121 RepID=UPI0020C24A7A|nr:hypothetical protein [Dyadobacter diqingensis]